MKQKGRPHFLLLLFLAVCGGAAFFFFLPRFYPYRAANIRIDKKQAVEIATEFTEEQDFDVSGFHVTTTMQFDSEAFIFLQKQFGMKAAQSMVRYKSQHGFDFGWLVMWFENLPRNAPQERFVVGVSGSGKLIGFLHEYPKSSKWPRPASAHLEQEEALILAQEFLSQYDIDLSEFQKELFTSTVLENRTDHLFQWRNYSDFNDSYVDFSLRVQGDRVGEFRFQFQLPQEARTAIKQQSGNEYFVDSVVSITALFLVGLVILSIFLKKYHDGEIEVKTGGVVFFILWTAFILQSVLRFRLTAFGNSLGELSYDGVALFILILWILIVRPFLSMFGLTAWSVGESLGREQFSHKFTALDGVLNRKFATLDMARSIFQGYCTGFLSLGVIGVLFWASLVFTGSTTGLGGYSSILPASLPFLLPVLSAITAAILGEMIFRLFGNLYLFRILKIKWLSVIICAAFWAFYVPAFWNIFISIHPWYYETLVWFIMGIFFGYIFWKFDLLTVLIANFITIGVMQSLPLLTSQSESIIASGMVALGLLTIPLIFMILGYIKRESFSFHAELVPGHIKRITERVRMSKELEIARQVQMRLLPKKSPIVPGFEISGMCIPAKETGGDYFDFIELGDSKLGIVIGDVSGKGVPAAIYMTLTKGIVQSHADDFISPGDVLVKVNNLLYRTIDKDSFVSLFYAVLDVKQKTIVYSRAGHNPVLYYRKKDGTCSLLEPDGIALGLEKGDIFKKVIHEKKIQLESGDLLVFYTDGFTEAMNNRNDEYGEERLIRIIHKYHDKSVDDIYRAVLRDVKQFVKDAPQHDDMTMIFIKGQ